MCVLGLRMILNILSLFLYTVISLIVFGMIIEEYEQQCPFNDFVLHQVSHSYAKRTCQRAIVISWNVKFIAQKRQHHFLPFS